MNDDDADFKPSQSTSSNLTSLFDANKPHSSGNVSLTYTAPKAPKDGDGPPPQQRQSTSKTGSNEKLKIITSKTVQVYKLGNEKYVNQGTAGVAIVGNYDLHMYQIILYKNNKEHICKILISINFVFTILENNYASFYDSSGQNWSILFSTLVHAQEFAKQIAIAKFNSQKNPAKIVIQDLLPAGANKNKAEKENVIKLKCNSFMLSKEEIVPLKEKPCIFVELLDCKTFPWHEGLRNCSEQCQRVIIMPHKMSAPWTEDIPPTAAVLLEFKIESITAVDGTSAKLEKMKLPKGGNASNIQEEIQADTSGDEDSCKERTSTLQERVLLSKVQKMDLITRIAKMGHALPLKGTLVSEHWESQEETHSATRPPQKSRTTNNAVQFNEFIPADSCPCYSHKNSSNQNDPQHQTVTVTYQRSGVNVEGQQILPFVTGPLPSKENETVQALSSKNIDFDLRLSIDKISGKVDNVLNKLEHLDRSLAGNMKEFPGQTSDAVGVIKTIQGVMSENETLKNDMRVMKSRIEEQNLKIQSLMDLTQSCVDKCSSTEKKNDSAKGGVSDSDENAKSSDHMAQATSKINQLISYIDNYRKELLENHNKIKESNLKVKELTEKLKKKDEEIENMKEELNVVRKEYMSLTALNESRSRDTISNRSEDFGGATEISKEPASEDYLYDEIKKVMNAINRRLQSSFENDKNYSGSDVKDKIARTIKGVFMAYMKYKGKGRNASREDARGAAERRSGPREMNLQSHSTESDSNGRKRSDDIQRIPVSRIKFADDQEHEINRVQENSEEIKPREVNKKSISDGGRSDFGASGHSVIGHASPRDFSGPTEKGPSQSVIIPSAVKGGAEKAVLNAEKSDSELMKESRSRSRSQKFNAEHEVQRSEDADELSKKSEILDEKPTRSIMDSSPRHPFEHEVEYGENFHEIPEKSEVLDESTRSVGSSQSPGLNFENDVRRPESADELFKKFETLDEEATHSVKGSLSNRPALEYEVEHKGSEQVDEHSKRSEILDEATRSVVGPVSRSPSHGKSDTNLKPITDHSAQRNSGNTDGSVSSEIQNSDNLSETSDNLTKKSPSEIEHEEQNTTQTDSITSVIYSRDQYSKSRKSKNENSMSTARNDTRQRTENVTSGTNLDKTSVDVTDTTYQEPVLKSILKNKEAGGSTMFREDYDFGRTMTSSSFVEETPDVNIEVTADRSSRTPSSSDGEVDKIFDDDRILTNNQNQDLQSEEEMEKSMDNLSKEPISDFNNLQIQSQASGADSKNVIEKILSRESVKEEEEKRKSTFETANDSTDTARMSSIKSETSGAGSGSKEGDDDYDDSRINNEEEKVKNSESKSSDSSRNSIPEKSNVGDSSDERSENEPVETADPAENADPPGQMSTLGLSEFNNSNGTMRKNFETQRNSKEEDEDEMDTRGSVKGSTDDDSLTRKISYIIKESEIEPTSVKISANEGFMKNYFRSLTEVSVEGTVAGYYVAEEQNRLGMREDEKANEGNVKEEDSESEEEEEEEKYNYKESLIAEKKNVTFSSIPNWGMSIPPPLPLDEDDSSSQGDEEWL